MQEQLRSGEPLIGTWTSLSDPAVAELLAPDFDFVMLDTEHAPSSLETVTGQARAVDAAAGDAIPLARVPGNDRDAIKRLLDVGVAGVMVPMIDTAAEAERAAAACRYPPEGVRGVAASRASDYGRDFEDYVERANDEVLTIAQIETEAAVDNAAEIAEVDGVDALFVGPADLSKNLGVLGEWTDETFVGAVRDVLEAGSSAGTPIGTIGAAPEEIRTLGSLGFEFVIAGLDTAYLLGGAHDAREAAEEALE